MPNSFHYHLPVAFNTSLTVKLLYEKPMHYTNNVHVCSSTNACLQHKIDVIKCLYTCISLDRLYDPATLLLAGECDVLH